MTSSVNGLVFTEVFSFLDLEKSLFGTYDVVGVKSFAGNWDAFAEFKVNKPLNGDAYDIFLERIYLLSFYVR